MNTDCVERNVAGSRGWSGICRLNEGLERGHFLKMYFSSDKNKIKTGAWRTEVFKNQLRADITGIS